MSRLIDKPIPPPTLDAQKRPLSFRWSGQTLHVVEILDTFAFTGQWWKREQEKTFWRVKVKGGGLYDLWHEPATETWGLYRIWD